MPPRLHTRSRITPARIACLAAAFLLAGRLGAQSSLYAISDQGLYVSQDVYGPVTNAAGWEVGTFSSAMPYNMYSIVKRPGDPGFSQLFSGYLYLDAAYGINSRNVVVGASNLFSTPGTAYRYDANINEMISLGIWTNLSASGFTSLDKATRILDNGTILGLGRVANGDTHVFQLTPVAPELHWDADGATAGLAQGSGTWSHAAANWTDFTTGTAVAGWTDGAIAHFHNNTSASTVSVADNIAAEGIMTGYMPYGLTIDATGGGTLTLTGQAFVDVGSSSESVTIDAPIAGSAGLLVTTNGATYGGTLRLGGANTYTGQTVVNMSYYGEVEITNAQALGATGPGNETVIKGGGVNFANSMTLAEDFIIKSASDAWSGGLRVQPAQVLDESENWVWLPRNVVLNGNIRLEESAAIGGGSPDYNTTLTVNGTISEDASPRDLWVLGATLTGTNTFSGDVVAVDDGVTVNTVANAGVAGPLGQGDRVVFGFSGEGTVPGSLHYTGATASMDRALQLVGDGTVDVVQSNTVLTLSGAVTDNGRLVKAGSGALTLTGANNYSGGTEIEQGILRITGTSALGTGPVLIDHGGMLTGPGTFCGDLTIHGIYSPGDGPGLVALSSSLVSLESDGLIHFEIGGLARGTQYDALDISGQFASEGGIKVSLINAFTPQLGDSFHLLSWGTPGTIGFGAFDLPALNGGLYWETGLLASTGQITVAAVPEPSTWLLLGLGVAGGLLRRFRTRR